MGWDLVTRIRQPRTGIDVTPFIGLVMTLLVVFMVMSPAIAREPVFPKARNTVPMKANRVTLGLDVQGRFWIEDVPNPGPVASRHLAGRIGEALRAHPAEERDVVYFKADRGVGYERVQEAMAAVRANGVRRVGLIAYSAEEPVSAGY